MGNVLISMDDDYEALLRQIAQKKYGGKKGSLRMVVQEALKRVDKSEDGLSKSEFLDFLDKGLNLGGYKMYRKRSEIYD